MTIEEKLARLDPILWDNYCDWHEHTVGRGVNKFHLYTTDDSHKQYALDLLLQHDMPMYKEKLNGNITAAADYYPLCEHPNILDNV